VQTLPPRPGGTWAQWAPRCCGAIGGAERGGQGQVRVQTACRRIWVRVHRPVRRAGPASRGALRHGELAGSPVVISAIVGHGPGVGKTQLRPSTPGAHSQSGENRSTGVLFRPTLRGFHPEPHNNHPGPTPPPFSTASCGCWASRANRSRTDPTPLGLRPTARRLAGNPHPGSVLDKRRQPPTRSARCWPDTPGCPGYWSPAGRDPHRPCHRAHPHLVVDVFTPDEGGGPFSSESHPPRPIGTEPGRLRRGSPRRCGPSYPLALGLVSAQHPWHTWLDPDRPGRTGLDERHYQRRAGHRRRNSALGLSYQPAAHRPANGCCAFLSLHPGQDLRRLRRRGLWADTPTCPTAKAHLPPPTAGTICCNRPPPTGTQPSTTWSAPTAADPRAKRRRPLHPTAAPP